LKLRDERNLILSKIRTLVFLFIIMKDLLLFQFLLNVLLLILVRYLALLSIYRDSRNTWGVWFIAIFFLSDSIQRLIIKLLTNSMIHSKRGIVNTRYCERFIISRTLKLLKLLFDSFLIPTVGTEIWFEFHLR